VGKIEKIIRTTAEEVIGKMQKKNYNSWFDDECCKIIKENNEARLKAIQRGYKRELGRYRELRREANRICRKKKDKMSQEVG